MDEAEKVESYRALYRVRPLIYHIGDIRLWMPIRQDAVVLWLVYIVVFFVFCYVFPVLAWVLPFDRVITMIAGPIAAAYYTVKLDPAGKTVPRYLQDVLQFIVRPKWIVRWQRIRQPRGRSAICFAGYCRPYERIALKDGEEEWRGGKREISGTVQRLTSLQLPRHLRFFWQGRTGRLTLTPLKRAARKTLQPPMLLEGRSRRTLLGAITEPVRIEREQRENTQEIWKVSKQEG
ncbi:TcpE family conjugal transfer membrane protein [Cohnella fermenti]|uniref:Conjugal transfer protein n=1 Tax=Cohnella fermenti TaxID=2565925 RepID=A0A4S4BP90_9BACL|nr:TcpE family conjugal transfer membrane protein [Cohnella fermenti]THF74367.1 hypothetical protein E6C55_25325 [Cohnella fermenti]